MASAAASVAALRRAKTERNEERAIADGNTHRLRLNQPSPIQLLEAASDGEREAPENHRLRTRLISHHVFSRHETSRTVVLLQTLLVMQAVSDFFCKA